MKKFLFVVPIFFFHLNANAQDSVFLFCYFKGNGDGLHYAMSEDGYAWKALFNDSAVIKPMVSRDKLMRDPCITRGRDGRFHMVWTVSWNDKGIGYASSADLIHWSEQKFIPVMQHEDSARNAWAPEINYDSKKKKYLIYWASTIRGKYPLLDTAAESGYNHRIYATETNDFKKFSKTKLFYDPGFSVIDASIIKDGRRYIMFLKNETKLPLEKNIRIAYSKKINGKYSAPGESITGHWVEGPTAIKIGNLWIVYFDRYREHKYGAVVSEDLIHWKDVSEKLSFPKGARHGTVIKISEKELVDMDEL